MLKSTAALVAIRARIALVAADLEAMRRTSSPADFARIPDPTCACCAGPADFALVGRVRALSHLECTSCGRHARPTCVALDAVAAAFVAWDRDLAIHDAMICDAP